MTEKVEFECVEKSAMTSFPSAQLDAQLSGLPSGVSLAQNKVIEMALVKSGERVNYSCWTALEIGMLRIFTYAYS